MDFETMVRRGLGRAVIYARENDMLPHRDFVINACLNDISFDPQLEMTNRARYMFDLIDATGERKFYIRAITEALQGETDDLSVDQAYEILGLLGLHGEEEARSLLYATVAQDPARHGLYPAVSLVEMDKLPGFLYVLERLPEQGVPEQSQWALAEMLQIAASKDEWTAVLASILATRPDLAPAVALVRTAIELRESPQPRLRNQRPLPDYDEITRLIQTLDKGTYPMLYKKWGAQLDEQTAIRLAEDTLREAEPERLRRYLYLFQKRNFPLDDTKFLDLALHGNYHVARAARDVLKPIARQDVRDLALRILSSDGDYFEAIDLLNRNYQDGDWAIVAKAVARDMDPNDYHGLVIETKHLFEDHPTDDAKDALLQLYECGPCSLCRTSIVEDLDEIGHLPDWMIAECHYDASEETQDFVRSLLPE